MAEINSETSGLTGNVIIQKLDEFIRKYYKNQLLRGSIYTVGLGIIFFLSAALIEYFGEFSSAVRMALFYSWVLSTSVIIARYIAIPLSKLYKLGKIISYEQAASIIGTHFHNVQDKLLNYLQLSSQKANIISPDLWQASINQKINELKPVPFTAAINMKDNRRYLKFVYVPLSVLIVLLFAAPSVLTEGTKRLVNYDTYYSKPAPFTFELQNKDLKALQQQDFPLTLKIKGNETPGEVYIEMGGNIVKLEKENNVTFTHTFKNVQENIKFHFTANGFSSNEFELVAIPKPTMVDFKINLSYPAYLGRKNETVNNTGDLIIPQGTKVQWQFNTRNSEFLRLNFGDTMLQLDPTAENKFSYSRRFLRGGNYAVKTGNAIINTTDSLVYSVNVIPDAFPVIDVSEEKDSLHPKNIYFSGTLKDDYGFTKLNFNYTHYTTDSSGNAIEKKEQINLGVGKNQVAQAFYHFFDMNLFTVKPGDKIEYYFEVWDNDGVNGSKSAKSTVMIFKAPTLDEINKQANKNSENIENEMENALKAAKDLQKQITELSKQVQEKKQLGWEEKKKMEDLINKQNELNKKIENFKLQNQQNNEMRNQFNQQQNEELMQKQEELEKLMENIMTPEMKKLFDELQKLMEKMADKQKVQETLEKMKMTDKDIEKELDRNLELFKQLEVEQKLEQAIEKLDELQKQQEQLSHETNPDKKAEEKRLNEKKEDLKKQMDNLKKETEDFKKSGSDDKQKQEDLQKKMDDLKKQMEDLKKQIEENKLSKDNQELEKKQEELTKKFDELKNEMKELDQKNKELETPNSLPNTEEMHKEISKEQNSAEEQLQQNNKKNASKNQKNASDQMQQMQQQMQMAQQQMSEEQEGEDMAAIRQLLENLLHLSFEQEELVNKTKKAKASDPNFTSLGQQQQKLREDAKKVEDSLLAISKRQPKISADVIREINAIQMNMGKSIGALEERNTYDASTRMQNIMTSINNLALMLNESLEQMQQAAAQKKNGSPGSGSCSKPGGSGAKPSMGSMRKMQEALNKQLQQMKDAMEKNGQKPGMKPGDKKGQNGMGGLPSEQFAKMAAQQEALRKMMQDAMKNMKDGGKNPGGNLANLMEETETELVNKIITQQTIERQKEILTRLLESEKAEREREFDEKRESNEADQQNTGNQNLFLEYKRMKEKELELLKTVPPSLTPYYKEKVSEYFNNYNKQ